MTLMENIILSTVHRRRSQSENSEQGRGRLRPGTGTRATKPAAIPRLYQGWATGVGPDFRR
jgi:hypothetical protein